MQQTLEQFGQTIKAKYPQYNDISDAELGQKILAKYPQYQDMVTQEQHGAPKIQQLQGELDQAQQESNRGLLGRFAGELPGQTAKALLQTPARFVASGALSPIDITRGLMGQKPIQANIPLLGQTFQGAAQTRMDTGENMPILGKSTPLKEVARATVEVPLAGLETLGIANTINKAGGILGNALKARNEAKIAETALNDVTPSYKLATPTEKKNLINSPAINGTPRIQEGGILRGRKVTPTSLEQEAGTELSNVKGYNPKSTYLEKQNLVKNEIANRGQALRESLAQEKVIVPRKEVISTVKKAINEVPEKSLLLQKSDPVIQNYTRVVQHAAEQNDGTLEGVLNVRQTMDNAYENARGKLAFNSDRLAPLDDVHRAGRDSLTQYLIDHAKNTDVKTFLRSQWNLYRGLDEITPKAAKEAGSAAGRFGQRHPQIKNVIKYGLGTTAVYEGAKKLGVPLP